MDNSKVMVIPVTLKGPNYLLWSRTTKIALCGRGLWNHTELVAEEEEDDSSDDEEAVAAAKLAKEAKWSQEDQTVLAIIQNSLVLEAYSFFETANELWETLKNVYGNISNLSRVFEVKKAINELSQEDLEFTRYLGKYRALWAELEMLRPNTMDVVVLNERKEQDKVFGLLVTLNPVFNDLIKHILRAENLPSLDDVCAQVQREQGSLGMFGGKGELPTANKGVFKVEDRRSKVCEHCKKKGHSKDKCWFLHPHLRPSNRPREPRANITQAGPSRQEEELASGDYVRKSDLEALIKSIASLKDS
ncbi:hypothetical protein AALP_AAs70579U000100, partial [Arabis alpina]